jgi:putative FmdB family regulatory protein
MPTYDYQCKTCGYVFEEFHMMSDPAVETCPRCGGLVKRLIGGGAGIIFKGSGFYVTDNSSSNKSDTPAAADEKTPEATEK